MEKVVALERQVLEQFEARCGAFGHRDGDGAIQLHDGRGLESGELSVERCDLAPVGVVGPLRLRMQGRDRSLELVGARPTQEQRAVEERDAAVDQVAVPCRPVLILEQHERSIRADARLGPRRLHVDRLPSRRDRQPRTGVLRDAGAWPRDQRGRQRVLERVLGELDVAEIADQGGDDAAVLGAEDRLQRRYVIQTGRTSIEPLSAVGIFAA
jgi:hypothetical protein